MYSVDIRSVILTDYCLSHYKQKTFCFILQIFCLSARTFIPHFIPIIYYVVHHFIQQRHAVKRIKASALNLHPPLKNARCTTRPFYRLWWTQKEQKKPFGNCKGTIIENNLPKLSSAALICLFLLKSW